MKATAQEDNVTSYFTHLLPGVCLVQGFCASSPEQSSMSLDPETLLEERLRSEQKFQQHLEALREALRQQLQETDRRQREDLDRRIHQNSLLSGDTDRESHVGKQDHQNRYGGLGRSSSTSALTSGKETLQHLRQLERASSSSPVWVSSTKGQHSVRTSKETVRETRQLQQQALSKSQLAPESKEEEGADAECQKKFCAVPVPGHVSLPLYHEMMQLREKKRKQGHEQRKDFLLSTQKPFSFEQREKEKREKLIATFSQIAQDQKSNAAAVGKALHKVVKDSSVCELRKDEELCTQTKTQETLRSSTTPQETPTQPGGPKPRTSEHTKNKMLAFLNEKPSFQPKINQQVPDFGRLHKALQTEAQRKTTSKDGTKCQPFYLRTSALSTRQSRTSPENSQGPVVSSHLKRSKSFGGLTSLSEDTLPTYITDATRKRWMAIRKSLELRDSKKQESADWLEKYKMRSHAMKKAVATRAKVLDPHSSLKEVCDHKIQQHREADLHRMREYRRELRDMKARVTARPYLFEQVTQRNAKAHVEKAYRDKLREVGLSEHFVEANGKTAEVTSEISRPEDDEDVTDHGIANGIHIREENVDYGEKIEDVEEKSVKSKGEEMP
ncbi:protein FAM161B [Myripristis murdjan]|uniref:protein FAM161B n=1 Tax=Myripristis murdjan TaxID=586833 RepID=UPI001175DA9E|nr:protein FAM161B [Myripristis murdjan]